MSRSPARYGFKLSLSLPRNFGRNFLIASRKNAYTVATRATSRNPGLNLCTFCTSRLRVQFPFPPAAQPPRYGDR